jgi:hypothetical protein
MEKFYEPQMVLMPKSILENIEARLANIEKMLEGRLLEEAKHQWIESTEARKMLGVSQKTWQTYRDNRIIPFSQFGRKIYVKREDLENFLAKHRVENFYEPKA